jgi:hypothetical protein
VSARIQQEKQLAALAAKQAETLRKRESSQHRDVERNPSPSQQKSEDQVRLLKEYGVLTDSIHLPHFERKEILWRVFQK